MQATASPSRPVAIPVTALLGRFVSTLDWDEVPSHIRQLMPVLLVDVVRAAAAGHNRDWTKKVRELYRRHDSDRRASVLFTDLQIDIAKAAFVNGVASGSLDWDDSHVAAIIHPGVVVWPAALAMAQVTGATGRELLTAVLAGYETAIRIGMAIQPAHSLRGFQGTPTCGAFGAAAACARLLGLSPERTRDALGIAATFACGLSQFFVSGSDIKRFHAGKAAANGIEAALLAHAGLTGPHDAIEGVQGFARAFSDRFDPEVAVTGLGATFHTGLISLKPHAGSVRMQSAIEAAAVLARQGLDMELVSTVEIGVHPAMVGKLTENSPIDNQQAQLSTPFAVAMALVLGQERTGPLTLSIDDFERCMQDPRIRNLSATISCKVDAQVEQLTTAEAVPARVTCLLKDGSRREHFIEHPKGCPQNPMTQQEVSQRFLTIAAPLLGAGACEDWLAQARQVERLSSLTSLFSLRA
jgi:2-methylcitrate dehydratase PrpD